MNAPLRNIEHDATCWESRMTRPKKLTDDEIREMQRMRSNGALRKDISKHFGVSINTVHFYTRSGYYEPSKPRLSAAERIESRFVPGLQPRWGRC